jgi:hypothetical protein
MTDVTSRNLSKEAGKKKDAMGAALVTVSTTAALAAVGNAINTTGKYQGKMVFNSTTNILVVAVGSTAASVWANAGTGVTAHTPV